MDRSLKNYLIRSCPIGAVVQTSYVSEDLRWRNTYRRRCADGDGCTGSEDTGGESHTDGDTAALQTSYASDEFRP